MKYPLRSYAWFISCDGKIVQGLITKRELLEVDDHNDGQQTIRRYFLRNEWESGWVDEEKLFDSLISLVEASKIKCSIV